MRARVLMVLAALSVAVPCSAAETKISCLTEQVWVRQGAPAAVIATFDDLAKSATVYAREFGGILQGTNVSVDSSMVMFDFTTKSGDAGDVTVMRTDGTLMMNVKGQPAMKLVAVCRKQTAQF